MIQAKQRRKCEICGAFFDVALVTDDRGVQRARTAGPWTCPRLHRDPGPGRRLERARGYVRLNERTWVPGRTGGVA